ncbi:MAG: hypothetical protein RIE73_38140 [Coleofasciculus sp. C1-SOL-03]|uniref:DUF6843 domain-containing protein n=1 Tax=Coleofasciculus sp. C1-SOL-03 TaxID=3069522 RepID=UPI0032F99B64
MMCLFLILLLTMGCEVQKAEPDIQTAKPEIHLIPEGFVGHVSLYFDTPDGAPKKWEGNARLYTIPSNGQFRTRFSPNLGIRPPNSMQFYYVDSQGNRTLIPSRKAENLSPETVVVSNVYVIDQELHYFIDRLDRIDTYKNPAIDEGERQ